MYLVVEMDGVYLNYSENIHLRWKIEVRLDQRGNVKFEGGNICARFVGIARTSNCLLQMVNKMSTKNASANDARTELAELVKRKAEIAVSTT